MKFKELCVFQCVCLKEEKPSGPNYIKMRFLKENQELSDTCLKQRLSHEMGFAHI